MSDLESDPDYPRAKVTEVDGQLVLDDPDARAIAHAVNEHNCRLTFDRHAGRVSHFLTRMKVLNLSPDETMIVLLCMDDQRGFMLGDKLMPGHDWQAYRDRGEVPYARGIVMRDGVEAFLAILDPVVASTLATIHAPKTAVLVMDHDAILVLPV